MSTQVQLSLPFNQNLENELKKLYPKMERFRILSQSLDARRAQNHKLPVYHYIVEIVSVNENFEEYREDIKKLDPHLIKNKPIIIGAGPGGLFCALKLLDYGIASIVIERGDRADQRMKKISKFWKHGQLDPDSNVCFGEGGAGLFSDGKLITRVKSPSIKYVMNKLVQFGAPPETAYSTNPHLGSNKIRAIISKMTDYLQNGGCDFLYNTRMDQLLVDQDKILGVKLSDGRKLLSSNVVLATGHSAKDVYREIERLKVSVEAKDFAVGVRVEHPRQYIDQLQYGKYACDLLGAARYRLSYHDQVQDRGAYTFCMCPGGYVLSSSTDVDGIVTNGMSNYARNSPWSNSAVVVSVKAGVDFKGDHPFAGLEFMEKIERKAFELSKKMASGRELPAISMREFFANKIDDYPLPKSSCPSHLFKASMDEIFPEFIVKQLKKSLKEFDQSLKGYIYDEALIIAPETRTSAPVKILRDKQTFVSTSHEGLYPCGEGAGHAGGITSAAVDGIKIAVSIANKLEKNC